jgi:hypothetical protein
MGLKIENFTDDLEFASTAVLKKTFSSSAVAMGSSIKANS